MHNFKVNFSVNNLAAYWVDFVTPVPSGIAHPLIEGMKNEVICQENSIDQYVTIKKTPFPEAAKIAIEEESEVKGTIRS